MHQINLRPVTLTCFVHFSDPDSAEAREPKYIKVANLPDDVTAKSLRSFIEAFGRVSNIDILYGNCIQQLYMYIEHEYIAC